MNPMDQWVEIVRRCWPDARIDEQKVAEAREYCERPVDD